MDYAQRFTEYFEREVARKAAKSIGDGAEMEFRVEPRGADAASQTSQVFTFTKQGGGNVVRPGQARDPQLIFTLTPAAADTILNDQSEEIGRIGVEIAKLIVSQDANKKVHVQLKAGFLSLFSKGYFGVLTAGGTEFAAFLASKGLNGMGAIKDTLKKLKT